MKFGEFHPWLTGISADGDRRKGDILHRVVRRLHRDDTRIFIPL